MLNTHHSHTITCENGLYRLTVAAGFTSIKLCYALTPDYQAKQTLFTDTIPCNFMSPHPAKRLFFELTNQEGVTARFATRKVEMPGITNLRDLGGCCAASGQTVRWGLLYRSAQLSGLSKSDLDALENLSIHTIFDLRSAAESAQFPDVVPAGCTYLLHPFLTTDAPSGNDHKGSLDMASILLHLAKHPDQCAALPAYMRHSYASMADAYDVMRAFFNRLLDKRQKPMLFHCVAGKDRTGVLGALTLLLLGVDRQTVTTDYLLSNLYRKEENDALMAKLAGHASDEAILSLIRSMLEVSPDLIDITLDAILQKYASWPNFFTQGLGFSMSDLDALQAAYLE